MASGAAISTGALSVAGDQAGPFKPGDELTADSGLKYRINSVLKENIDLRLYVCRASAQDKDYVVKKAPDNFDYQIDLQKRVAASPNIRTAVYTHDILHNDIRPNNMIVDYEQAGGSQPQPKITAVQITDLDDAVIVSPGKYLRGPLCGNQFCRSPESWARSAQNQASDIFSFGIVAQSSHQRKTPGAGYYPFISLYFGDQEGLNGLIDHLGEEDPFTQRIIELASPFSAPNTRKPFQMRHGVDVQFRDLVSRLTNLAPAARITARQALEHEWFRNERGVVAPKVELEEARAASGIDSLS
ncbi:hypothetical protein N0V93_000576 [Gnomoniopsis smithogilvyi]|uniref:Protein kinase domain-containing protein n=1 Tax=Gnomoniopsis smithogilvyi TaxID=1191159 RepID=A0A9W8Z493_9PEZI|nr:hypothetical protein N0V93_000576 [Gnomoniopsis smithogilvyi]